MHKSVFHKFILLVLPLLFLLSCDTEDPFSIPPPNHDSVPDPIPLTGLTPVQVVPGVEAYIHEEGFGEFFVTARDDVSAYITLRTDEGDIIFSSFANENDNPSLIVMGFAGTIQNDLIYSVSRTYSPGLKAGLLGMKQGESRTLVVSPEMGFKDALSGSLNAQYSENTLYYEIRISRILPD